MIMKVLVVNPWVGNIAEYTHGLCEGLSNVCEVTLVTNYHDTNETEKYRVIKSFFKDSELMERGIRRKILRGFEYVKTYHHIISLLKKNRYDVVHVQWFLMYSLDINFIRMLRKHAKVVMTAHNVLPHVQGEKYIGKLDAIYNLVDMIFVHGETIKTEFLHYFPSCKSKIRIQNHGEMMSKDTSFDLSRIANDVQKVINSANRKFIFFGNIFYNKGTDMLLKAWIDYFAMTDNLLIIAGRTTEKFETFEEQCARAKNIGNILIFNSYIDDNLLNYLISSSDMVVLPYRHASMSGVVFTAAQFKKPIICTDTGSITEYVCQGENCFVCSATEEGLKNTIEEISENYPSSVLKAMGNRLYEHINTTYSWSMIANKLFVDYQDLLKS